MLSLIAIQPWESPYVLFLIPGIITWIVGAAWCVRSSNAGGAVILQVVGSLEVALGAGAAYVKGSADVGSRMLHSGSYDPLVIANDHGFLAQVGLIGFVAHWVLLLVTLLLVVVVRSRNSSSQQDVSGTRQ